MNELAFLHEWIFIFKVSPITNDAAVIIFFTNINSASYARDSISVEVIPYENAG